VVIAQAWGMANPNNTGAGGLAMPFRRRGLRVEYGQALRLGAGTRVTLTPRDDENPAAAIGKRSR